MGINKYKNIKVSSGNYKKFLGGGDEFWKQRGEFQLHLLKFFGLKSHNKLADIGCGPLRAGSYFIEYLDSNMYFGFDSNKDFINISKSIIENNILLNSKKPSVKYIEDFKLNFDDYDFVILFSVLNHCDSITRKKFFSTILKRKKSVRIFVTHAKWFNDPTLKIKNIILNNECLPKQLDIEKWGWKNSDEIFPILEL